MSSKNGDVKSSNIEFELDHIGIAVKNLDDGGAFYRALGMIESDREEVASEKVKTAFFPLGNGADIELLESMDPEGTIAKYIDKRGPGIHHICLRVKNIDALVAKLKAARVRLINDVPKAGAHNCRIVFVHPVSAGGVLIELSEPGD